MREEYVARVEPICERNTLENNRIKATPESIRVQRSGNAANNVSSVFEFRYCRITPSRFT